MKRSVARQIPAVVAALAACVPDIVSRTASAKTGMRESNGAC
jgi:hypothetical protein